MRWWLFHAVDHGVDLGLLIGHVVEELGMALAMSSVRMASSILYSGRFSSIFTSPADASRQSVSIRAVFAISGLIFDSFPLNTFRTYGTLSS